MKIAKENKIGLFPRIAQYFRCIFVEEHDPVKIFGPVSAPGEGVEWTLYQCRKCGHRWWNKTWMYTHRQLRRDKN